MQCPGCFQEKEENTPICPYCQFDESEQRSPLVLPFHTVLHNQYVVGKVLGKPGGFGITYLGWDTLLETLVAIKEYLPRDLAGRRHDCVSVAPHTREDEELFKYGLEQFMQEARTMAKISHPNVVRVRYFFTENGTAYLVMDYYEGVPLSEYLTAAGGKIPEQAAVGIILRVLDGLKEIHDKGFLHRDIKPHNIYLTTEGKPILLDMGAARTAVGDKSKSLSVLYSSGFTPFEQYYRRGDQGAWTDIYACGATLYYMLTGVVPPDSPGRLGEDELIHPTQLDPAISVPVADAVLQALSMNPAMRPQTAQQFQALLLTSTGVLETDEQSPGTAATGSQPLDTDPQATYAGHVETPLCVQTAAAAQNTAAAPSIPKQAEAEIPKEADKPDSQPHQHPTPPADAAPQYRQRQPSSSTNTLLIVAVVLIAMLSGAILYRVLSPGNGATRTAAGDAGTSGMNAQKSPMAAQSAISDFDKYFQYKDTFDTQIRQLASAVNDRIADSRGRLAAPDLLNQVQDCENQMKSTRNSLAATSFPAQLSDVKSRLLAVYDLELIRVDCLRRGLLAGSQGRDYLPIFKEGGDAYDQFEKQSSELNKAYADLRAQLGR